jgi:large repetitive protein
MSNIRIRATTFGATLTLALTITEGAAAPAARAIAPVVLVALPATGPVGTSVTITGTGFADSSVVTGVAFNGTTASFSVDSNTQITATVPLGATTGPVSVTDAEGTGATALDFVVTPSPPPTVLLFDPSSGPAGTTVTITAPGTPAARP